MDAAAAASSSSSALPPKKNDVFISFRGEDTRSNFTSHLYTALCQKGIITYKDDNELPKGDEITPSLMQAIEDSNISLVVFSENYATSKWCLNELVKIIDCKRDHKQIVIPVFYNVDPSHVRHQKETYKDAFDKHERDFRHRLQIVKKWRHALSETANLSGWDSSTCRDDSELIQRIVEDVLEKLDRRYPATEVRMPVGVSCGEIEALLKENQIIGVWGMGGLGKTTMARTMFDKLSPEYDGRCFLENIRESTSKCGLRDLLCKLNSELLGEEIRHDRTNAMESSFVKHRLKRKKVLTVLDDINDIEQLEYLALDGATHRFGPGSRIIITTRDKNVLSKGVDKIYEVKPLMFEDSLQLFCSNAFNQNLPIMGYEEISKSMVSQCKGLPLALKVMGSFLRDRSEYEWNSTLRKLEKSPHADVMKVLRISYDGLNREEKEIFLDMACFFNGWSKDHVMPLAFLELLA